MAGELTGRKVLAIVVTGFGVVIAVNLLMAFMAIRSFPGLETPNSYVASQQFDADRAAQQALGWTVTPDYDGETLTLALRDKDGNPARVADMTATVGRPTHVRDDVTPQFTYRGGLFTAPLILAPGIWNIHVRARAFDGTEFRQRIDHYHGSRVAGQT